MADKVNMHLLSTEDGDEDVGFATNMTNADLNEHRGIAEEGRYELICAEAKIVKAKTVGKDGLQGRNIRFVLKIAGPVECPEVGKVVYRTSPIPIGDPDTKEFQNKEYFHNRMVGSFMSASGKDRETIQKLGLIKEIKLRKLHKQKCYGYVTETISTNGNPMNEVDFIMRQDYDAQPGPVPKAAGDVQPSQTTQPSNGGQPRPGVPQTGQPKQETPNKMQPPPQTQQPPPGDNGGSDPVSDFLGGV